MYKYYHRNLFPRIVEFQTHSYCNSRCLYCPFGSANINLPEGKMEYRLFKKIVDECSHYKLDKIIPYLDNEPFLDDSYIDKLRYIRKKMPDVLIEIATNVEQLTAEKAEALFDIENTEIRMSIHGLFPETYHTLMKGLDYKKVYENVDHIVNIREKKQNNQTSLVVVVLKAKLISHTERMEVRKYWKEKKIKLWEFDILNRSGHIEDTYGQFKERKIKRQATGCFMRRPTERFHILYNGKVICCDHDWKRKNLLGDLNENSIAEIWNSGPYMQFRQKAFNMKPSTSDFICKKCEFSYSGWSPLLKTARAIGVRI